MFGFVRGALKALGSDLADVLSGGQLSKLSARSETYAMCWELMEYRSVAAYRSRSKAWDERDAVRAEAQAAAEMVRAIAQEKYDLQAELHDAKQQRRTAVDALVNVTIQLGEAQMDQGFLLAHSIRLYKMMLTEDGLFRMSREFCQSTDDHYQQQIQTLTNDRDLWKLTAEQAREEVQSVADDFRDSWTKSLEVERNSHSAMYGDLDDRHSLALTEINQLQDTVASKERSIDNLEYRFRNVLKERDSAIAERDKLRVRPIKVSN